MYKTDCNRKFYTLKEKRPKENESILIHTKEDEVVNVKCIKIYNEWYFQLLDFAGSIDEHEVKGWNYLEN